MPVHFRALEGMLSGPVATVVDREYNWLTIYSRLICGILNFSSGGILASTKDFRQVMSVLRLSSSELLSVLMLRSYREDILIKVLLNWFAIPTGSVINPPFSAFTAKGVKFDWIVPEGCFKWKRKPTCFERAITSRVLQSNLRGSKEQQPPECCSRKPT